MSGPPLAPLAVALNEALHRCDPVFSGAGPLIAAAQILAVLVLVPKDERWKARGPTAALVAAIGLTALDAWLPERVFGRNIHRFIAQFLLLASMGRTAFILAVEVLWSNRRVRPLPTIFKDVIQALVYIVVGLLVLRAAGVEPGSLLTTSALLTAVLGLSLQDTLGNLFAGLAIQAQQPFQVGDWIQFDNRNDQVGRVIEINWRATRIITLSQIEITIPNGLAAKSPVFNYSRPSDLVRQDVKVVVPFSISPDRARALMLQAVRHTPEVLETPEPFVVTVDYDERGIIYEVRYFITRFDQRDLISSDVRERIWYALGREGHSIPVPARRVELIQSADAQTADSRSSVDFRYRLLARLELFAGLSQQQLHKLAEHTRHQAYGHEELIVKQGDRSSEMYVVERGQVRIEAKIDGALEPHVISVLGRGEFFGEMSMLTGEARAASVIAVEETEVLVLERERFAPLLESNPKLAERISQVLTTRRNSLREAQGNSLPSPTIVDQDELLTRIRRFFSLS